MPRGAYVWVTSRSIKKGRLEDFKEAWTPKPRPKGLLAAYLCVSEKDEDELLGVSVWTSKQTCQRYMQSMREKERGAAMRMLIDAVNWAGFYRVAKKIRS